MFGLPIFSKKNQPDSIDPAVNLLAIDIGTEMLKTLLFSCDSLGVQVHKVSRIQQQQHAMNKGVIQNLNTVLDNCRLAISEVTSGLEPDQMPKGCVLGIAGEYVQGVSIVVNYEREENFDKDVTPKEEYNIISKVHEQIGENGKDDLARRTGLMTEDVEILHITTTGMEIGGMNVDSLVGFRGKSVKLYFYASFAPKTYVEALRKLVDSLGLAMMGIVAQPFAVARAFAGGRNKTFSGIFVDIGGGTTDVAVVNSGNVLDTQMFGFGGRVFTKEIASAMNIDYRHAEMRKIKYSEGKLDQEIHSKVKTVMYDTVQIWLKGLRASLESAEDVGSFPTNIYLCGGGSLLPDIRNGMLEYPWNKFLPFPSVPKITLFLPERLYGISDQSGELKHTYDVTPAALARFAYDKLTTPDTHHFTLT